MEEIQSDIPQVAKSSIVQPSTFSRDLLLLCSSQKADTIQFIKHIEEDIRFSSNLLKYINTIARVATVPAKSVAEAVEMLGTDTIANLSLFWSLLTQHKHGNCSQFDYQRFWQKSLAVGNAARALAFEKKVDGEKLFACGVLAQIGELALANANPKEYGKLIAEAQISPLREQQEKISFGVSSSKLTLELLARWQVPQNCVELIRNCYQDAGGLIENTATVNSSSILQLARQIAGISLLELPLLETFLAAEKQAEEHGIKVEEFGPFFDELITSWHVSFEFFEIPSVHCPNYHQIKTLDDASVTIGHDKSSPLTFLAADDDPMTLIYLKKMLAKDNRQLLTTENGEQALALALEHRPHILITDWRMPGLSGIDLCKILRKTKVTERIYIIMLTSNESEDELVQAFDAGADDYVVKPFTPKVLDARISSGERIIRYQQTIRRDQEIIQQYATQLATANRELQSMAMTDFLTGLPNRRNGLLRLRNIVDEVQRYREPLSCLMIDIDHFKLINDTHGHDAGDIVLQQVSKLLEEKARSYDTVSRWGGEEFLIICARSGPHDSFQLAERLRRAIEEATICLADGTRAKVTISIGVASWSHELQNEDALIKEADTYLYQAKKNGRNRVESSVSTFSSSFPL